MELKLKVNYKNVKINIDPTKRLIDFLREDLNLTGVKEGCSEGECGACTIILNEEAVTSCTILAGQVDGCEIITIEGLEQSGELDVIQKSFIENGAIQCGFCTPGMILSCKALLLKNPNPTEDEIKRAIEGNLCRCTGYNKIVKAVKDITVKEV
ncbi:(2Fe-2S)-binding protein [Sedimentibacter sp. MB31-C6]|uniref:(2Fe-2S)-binding protein n=1 Tax=Sedimentibacter sp. MB31-C6 TaxID=3109366 RepID=UPI002DDD252A|nr:(2Fe-2S)-binding protein [Sedimentibacter sp. MB36-C1]WSI04896.1 (2Fe-2S)-binding protein [Sedimentibacter sp. MB36-C1]